ncbi:MAG: hypothetical protein IJW45_03750 [Oscillospiraceae bacterium]|nr:hypothetical protein [Oscillospiraceae bacterium]
MDSKDYWQMFLETGVPEYYLLYSRMLKTEGVHVPDDTLTGPTGHGLQ